MWISKSKVYTNIRFLLLGMVVKFLHCISPTGVLLMMLQFGRPTVIFTNISRANFLWENKYKYSMSNIWAPYTWGWQFFPSAGHFQAVLNIFGSHFFTLRTSQLNFIMNYNDTMLKNYIIDRIQGFL